MVNKDWENYENEFFTKGSLSISINEKIGYLGSKSWYVTIGDYKDNIIKLEKPFKTKSQALSYAKSYMRTH